MKELNPKVKAMLEKETWFITTGGVEPNTAVACYKEITKDGKLIVAVLDPKKLTDNIEKNNKIAVAVSDAKSMTGYQIKGTAKFITDSPIAEKWKTVIYNAFNNVISIDGVVEITPLKTIITTPGKHNNEEVI